MNKKYVIGLDIGTTSAKSVLFNTDGTVSSEHEVTYPTTHPQPSWMEQDPYEIEAAAITAIKSTIDKASIHPNELISVGISAAMHSLICIDDAGEALTNSITWADGRSVNQANELKGSDTGNNIYLKTGTPIHPMTPLLKLVWMKETGYLAYEKAWKFISIKEFLIYRWFNQAVVDYSIASATGMFNIHTLKWEDDALELAGIREEQLSEPVPPTYLLEGLSASVAERMGVDRNLPFAIGASDGPLANLGIGATESGDTAMTIGTSGAIRQMSAKPKTDIMQEVFCYAVSSDLWILGGPTNNGGNVLQWLTSVLGEKEIEQAEKLNKNSYDLITELASSAAPGSNGLLFLPFLHGERAPHWNANARGSYIGLSSEHKKEHLLRAGLEGVIYNLYDISLALNRLAGPTKTLYASGGFSRSPFWLQILADIFGQEIHIPKSHQSSAWGAAWYSLLAVNHVSSLNAIKNSVPMKEVIQPNAVTHDKYVELYGIYHELYRSLESSFNQLASLQRKASK